MEHLEDKLAKRGRERHPAVTKLRNEGEREKEKWKEKEKKREKDREAWGGRVVN